MTNNTKNQLMLPYRCSEPSITGRYDYGMLTKQVDSMKQPVYTSQTLLTCKKSASSRVSLKMYLSVIE